tara:strand:+ start:10048 stop:10728 length:681 start_codon:yes stop_codon:yes gene_type:complete
MAWIAVGIGVASLASSAYSAHKSNQQAKRSGRRASRLEGKMDDLEANRQEVINPFSGMRNLSDMVSNPFANLQVATEAAEFQAEEADIALANMVDTLQATGQGAGGATALAQAALRSKRGISADIAKQEAENEMARATGEANAQTMRFNEARRMQAMTAQGRQYMFETQENRDIAQLDRLAGLITGARSNENKARGQSSSIIGSALPNALMAGLGAHNAMNPTGPA